MKIAIKINFFQKVDTNVSQTPRAADTVAYLLAEELVKRNYNVTLFVTSDSETSARIAANTFDSQDEDVKFCADFSAGKINENDLRFKDGQIFFGKNLKKSYLNIVEQASQFDLIHTHDWNVENSIAEYVKNIPVPVVTTLHGGRMKYDEVPRNHYFIAISEFQKKLYSSLPIVGVAYNGIKIEDFEFSDTPEDYLAYLGRITPDKGTLEAIEAAKRTQKRLLIGGNLDSAFPGYIRKFLEEVGSSDNIEYLGEVGKEKKNSLLKNANATLMPIQWDEPFGLVAIESMACGTPVIAWNRAAMPEIIEDGVSGYLINSVDELIKRIGEIEQLSRSAVRKRVEEKFSARKMAEKYVELYEKILG